jgi:pyrroloquinoline quinone (PQQ) biosynthesis protein C
MKTDLMQNDRPETETSILNELEKRARRQQVVSHPFLKRIRTQELTKPQVSVIVGQYWYPIHYVTEFLPKVIAVVSDLSMRTYVSKILWQELGEGDPDQAHETLYLETMVGGGIDADDVRNMPALSATDRLVHGYRDSTSDPFSAIGFLYGTEVIDLAMVSSVGAAVRNTTGVEHLPWVDIHLKQEPDHVSSVKNLVASSLTEEQRRKVVEEAENIWSLWSDFYDAIQEKIDNTM